MQNQQMQNLSTAAMMAPNALAKCIIMILPKNNSYF
jgi:hypothetical protein